MRIVMQRNRVSPGPCDSVKHNEIQQFELDGKNDVPAIEKRNRRRSSFFAEARKSLRAQESPCSHGDKQIYEEMKTAKYIEELKKEGQKWIDVMKKRKVDYEDMHERYSAHCEKRRIMTEEECWTYLDENDRQYLKGLPNFAAIETKYRQITKRQKVLNKARKRGIHNARVLLEMFCEDTEEQKNKIRKLMKAQPL